MLEGQQGDLGDCPGPGRAQGWVSQDILCPTGQGNAGAEPGQSYIGWLEGILQPREEPESHSGDVTPTQVQ